MASSTRERAASPSPARTSAGRGPSSRAAQSTSSVLRPASWSRWRARPSRSASSPTSGAAALGQLGAQPPRQRGAGPTRGDGDRHRTVAVHRRQDERAVRHVVGAVDPHPGRLGIGVDRAVDVGDSGGGDHQAVAGRVTRGIVATLRWSAGSAPPWRHRRSGAITVTRAPQRTSPPALRAATGPPPTTRQGRPPTSSETG